MKQQLASKATRYAVIASGVVLSMVTSTAMASEAGIIRRPSYGFRTEPEIVELLSICEYTPRWETMHFSLAKFQEKDQIGIEDDGKTVLEIHGINGRYGPNGAWFPVTSPGIVVSGGENYLRFDIVAETELGTVWDMIRLRHDGWGSNVFQFGEMNC